LAVFSLKEG